MSPAAILMDKILPEGSELQPRFANYVLWTSPDKVSGDQARSIAQEIIAARFKDGRSKRARQKSH